MRANDLRPQPVKLEKTLTYTESLHAKLLAELAVKETFTSERINPDTMKSGFNQRKNILDDKFYLVATGNDSDYGGSLTIQVFTNEKPSEEIGYAGFSIRNRREDNEPHLRAGMITVLPRFRKMGIAKEIYKFVNELGNDIAPSTNQTADGQAMWKGLSKHIRQPDPIKVKQPEPKLGVFDKIKKFANIAEAEASDADLRARWGDFDPEDRAMLPQTQTNLQGASTLWTAYAVVQNILGKNRVTNDEDELTPNMYYVYQSNEEPMFKDTDNGVGSINLPNLDSTAAKDVAVAAHEAFHAYVHSKSQGGVVHANEKIINNLAEKWLRKHLSGPALHVALEKITGSRIHYGPSHMPNSVQTKEDMSRRGFLGALGIGAMSAATGVQAKTNKPATAPTLKQPVPNPPPAKKPVPAAPPVAQEKIVQIINKPEAKALISAGHAGGIKGVELAQLVAQCAVETAYFTAMKEKGGGLDFKKYDPRANPRKAKILGNTKPGDGARYHGRGYIQLTGRDNYKRAGLALKLPLEAQPEMVEEPDIAARVAVWFWKSQVRPKVTNFHDTAQVTKPINSGLHGLDKRERTFAAIMDLMKRA
jgi:putative chitinase